MDFGTRVEKENIEDVEMVSSGDLFYDWADISLLERITRQVVCETLDTNTVRVHDKIYGAEGCRERLRGCGL